MNTVPPASSQPPEPPSPNPLSPPPPEHAQNLDEALEKIFSKEAGESVTWSETFEDNSSLTYFWTLPRQGMSKRHVRSALFHTRLATQLFHGKISLTAQKASSLEKAQTLAKKASDGEIVVWSESSSLKTKSPQTYWYFIANQNDPPKTRSDKLEWITQGKPQSKKGDWPSSEQPHESVGNTDSPSKKASPSSLPQDKSWTLLLLKRPLGSVYSSIASRRAREEAIFVTERLSLLQDPNYRPFCLFLSKMNQLRTAPALQRLVSFSKNSKSALLKLPSFKLSSLPCYSGCLFKEQKEKKDPHFFWMELCCKVVDQPSLLSLLFPHSFPSSLQALKETKEKLLATTASKSRLALNSTGKKQLDQAIVQALQDPTLQRRLQMLVKSWFVFTEEAFAVRAIDEMESSLSTLSQLQAIKEQQELNQQKASLDQLKQTDARFNAYLNRDLASSQNSQDWKGWREDFLTSLNNGSFQEDFQQAKESISLQLKQLLDKEKLHPSLITPFNEHFSLTLLSYGEGPISQAYQKSPLLSTLIPPPSF